MDLGSYGWTLDDSASFVTTTGVSASTTAIQILGSPMDSTTIAYQDVPINLSGSETYVLSGWVKANAVPDNVSTASDSAQDVEKQCGLRAILTYSDGAVEYHYVPFNTDLQDWQFTSLTIVPKQPTKTVRTIRVVLAYEKNANTAYFDNISLVREAAQTMAYDGDGNLTSVTATGLTADTDTYSGGNLIQTVTGGNGTYNYTYDTTYTHRLKSVTNGLVTQSMGYDSVGNVTSTTLTGGSLSMATSAAYDATGNRLTSITDSAGSTVTYGYSSGNSTMWGLPTTVTAPNNTVTTTAYDAYGRVTQNSIANTASVGYTYSKGMLAALQRTAGSSTQTYNFTYDSFGNTTAIKVGSTALASYTYASKNGLLTSMTYGNNATVSYTYDTLGRIKTETYADGRVVSYTYTGDGQLYSAKETKGSSSTLYIYTYDTLGRLVGSQQIKDGTTELRTDQTYNANNQLTKQAWQLGSTTYSETYTYNTTDGSLATHGTATGQTASYSYDALRRVRQIAAGSLYTKSYGYRSLGNNRTTAQVTSLIYEGFTDAPAYGYTYDSMGNIATYTAGGETVTYTYDAQGQLLKAVGDETYTYTYDTAGNILTASNGTVSHSYTYSNTNWRDLLTAFDGESITYDAIGNPTSYYNGTRWTFGWSNGRQLTSASNGTNSITYTYTADGMRTSKVVDGVTYNYYYASGKLLRQTWGTNTLDFFYDTSGVPYALKHNGTLYYYITNLQGDVLHLIDGSGNIAATYEYDPYGNILTATGTMAAVNPLRYRGYYYDTEAGLYYLQSRYYDPTTGRFINADSYVSTGQGILGNNMFAYCNNNPIRYYDPFGTSLFEAIQDAVEDLARKIDELISIGKKISVLLQEPSQEEMAYAATIYTEAAAQNSRTKRAIAHVIYNRIGTRSSWDCIQAVISAPYQFSGYNNSMYKEAMRYYDTGQYNNSIEKAAMDECLSFAIMVNRGIYTDITGGALYFHSLPNPEDWKYHQDYTQVFIDGTELFYFYK